MKKYYQDQLNKITKQDIESQFSPIIQVKAGDSDNQTKWLNLNEESAKVLIEWLNQNFVKKP